MAQYRFVSLANEILKSWDDAAGPLPTLDANKGRWLPYQADAVPAFDPVSQRAVPTVAVLADRVRLSYTVVSIPRADRIATIEGQYKITHEMLRQFVNTLGNAGDVKTTTFYQTAATAETLITPLRT